MIDGFNVIKNICIDAELVPTVCLGYWNDVVNQLSVMGYDKTKDGEKYPLIIINTNSKQTNGDSLVNSCVFDEIRIYIACEAVIGESFEDKMLNRYKSILYPIYDSLMNAFFLNRNVNISSNNSYKLSTDTVTLYPFLNNVDSSQNKINDIVDALEIKIKNFKLINIKSQKHGYRNK